MAASAVIGALRVDLGLNSAQFQAGLKNAQKGLGDFGKAVGKGLGIVAVAAAGAATALGVAVKGAIDHADELSKASQKIGVSVEALSRLEYAAQLSDVSLEQLTGGLGKFSKAIVEAATNSKSGPASVFSALGISIKDAAGNLRDNDQIFADVADKLSRMEDGALKTSLAMQLFGKSGADLIPLLNSGRDGLAAMADESDRVGATISTKTARAAETFNDTLTRIGSILGGVVNKVMEAALPALQSLADTLASPEFAAAAQTLATVMVEAFNAVVQAVVSTTNAIVGFMEWMKSLDGPTPGNGAPLINGMTPTDKYNLGQNVKASSNYPGFAESLYRGFNFGTDGKMQVQQQSLGSTAFTPVITGADAAKTAVIDLMDGIEDAQPKVEDFAQTIADSLAGAFSSFADAVMSGVPAIEALSDVLGDLGKQLLNSAISGFFTNLFGGGFSGLFGGGAASIKMPALYADGGIATQPSIFGDNGPEAAVPLPDGRTIPVTLSGGGTGGGYLDVRVTTEVRNGNLVPVMTQVAGQVAGQKIKTDAPAAVANAQRNRGMGG